MTPILEGLRTGAWRLVPVEATRIVDRIDRQNVVNDRYASDLPKAERHTSELWLICNSHIKDRARELREALSTSPRLSDAEGNKTSHG